MSALNICPHPHLTDFIFQPKPVTSTKWLAIVIEIEHLYITQNKCLLGGALCAGLFDVKVMSLQNKVAYFSSWKNNAR